MQPNPINSLFHSRKFLLALTDAVASSVLLLATRFLSPGDVELVKQIVVIYQPVLVAVIASIAWEDNTQTHADAMVQAAIASKPSAPATSTVSTGNSTTGALFVS